ncbi:MAG: hypothetical protein KJN96_05845 [Eudoraea sp.]|nr:hypothetical protein [Eudoraea sp.]MBT8222675.1 hypothetical protein [Eudoraea sp.]
MKKYIFSLIAALGLLTSCEEDLIIFDTPEGFVQVESEALSATEEIASTTPITVSVLLGSDSNTSGVSVAYTISSSDPSRYTLSVPASGTLDIPAGEFTNSEIQITAVDNLIVDGSLDVTVTLESSTSVPIGTGGEGNNFTSTIVTLIDDDCPFEGYEGIYDVSEAFTGPPNAPLGFSDFFGESYQVEISVDPTDPSGLTLIVNNSAGFNTFVTDGTRLSIDPCPGLFEFTDGDPEIAEFTNLTPETTTFSNVGGRKFSAEGDSNGFGLYGFTWTQQTP